jgi:alpha-tubulin suppressor-like RCC1 family protein
MAWGYNGYSAIGNGESGIAVPTPVPVLGLSEVTQVTGGGETHGLAVVADGTARSWGNNYYGGLGNGTTSDRSIAGIVLGLSDVVSVAGGEDHSLALLSNGMVMAWGANGNGQLGLGSTVGPQACLEEKPCAMTPVQVPGVTNAVAVAAGAHFSLALLADGTVMAWGKDFRGELGDGRSITGGCKCVPTPMAVPGVSNAISIDASDEAGIALLADGTVRTWGDNRFAQAGGGIESTSGCECVPATAPPGITTAVAVDAGYAFGLAVLANGTVMGWGANDESQLATGSNTGPEVCSLGLAEYACSRTPIVVGGLTNVRAVSALTRSAFALLNDGTARSWGSGFYGELGNGSSTETAETATPVPVSSVTGASSIGNGEYMGYALIGPSQTLSVELAGAGTGAVTGREISCPPRCSGRYPQGQVAMITATPSDFAGFSGACTGLATCRARMDVDRTVTATFGVPKGTTITAATILSKKKMATFSFSAPGAVTGYQCQLIRPKPKKIKKKRKAAKSGKAPQKKPEFTACGTPTTYKRLRPGRYTFSVRALDIIGADARPATRVFKIKPKKKKKRRPGRRG